MSLPRQIQQAEEAANALIKGNTAPAPEETPPTQETKQPPETPPAQEVKEQTPPQATSDNIDWKAKYQVLQGKYNKEVPTLQDRVKTLEQNATTPTEANSALLQEVEQLRQQVAQMQQPQAAKAPPTLNEHLVSEYGEDFAKAVAETANEQVNALRSEIDNRFTEQQQDISSWTTESKMTAVKQSLASMNIDFNLVDNDPLFHDWLREADQYSGQTRHSMMMNAFEGGDLNRVIRFYHAFVESHQVHAEQHPFTEHIQPNPSAAPDAGTTRPIFDPNAFQELHRKYQRGQISEADFQKAEREMYAALSG